MGDIVNFNPFKNQEEKLKPSNFNAPDPKRMKEFRDQLAYITDNDQLTYIERLDLIIKSYSEIIPECFAELVSEMPNDERSQIASRTMAGIEKLMNMMIKKHEAEISEDFDLNSPKLQMVFQWFLDVFREILNAHGLDRILINNIFNDLANNLIGWEDQIQKKMKGVSHKALSNVENPLVLIYKEAKEGEGS